MDTTLVTAGSRQYFQVQDNKVNSPLKLVAMVFVYTKSLYLSLCCFGGHQHPWMLLKEVYLACKTFVCLLLTEQNGNDKNTRSARGG